MSYGPDDLPDVLADLRAIQIHQDMESLSLSRKIHRGNYEELMDEHRRYNDFSSDDWLEVDVMDLLKNDYLRLLHNYSSSSWTLINHSQRIIDKHGDDGFSQQYSAELKERRLHNTGQFFKQIRHYTQKRKMPPVEALHSFTTDGVEFNLFLRRDMMMDWAGWNKPAREYLNKLGDRVPIESELVRYQSDIESFHDWFSRYTKLYFREEYDKALETIQKLDREKPDTAVYDPKYVHPFDADDFR